ncbi:hypothetical protein SDC9_07977 [bioreactor metagenome]|uniref:Uncharacterized protein n=1 Tax=bioreactor metagenome TaxID=1076179 RepID=A0A644T790_9ZZZZ|nr:hypothetical protein [Candidatus Elulimicrobiales bacterium]
MEIRGTKTNPVRGKDTRHILKEKKNNFAKSKKVEEVNSGSVSTETPSERESIRIPSEPLNPESQPPESKTEETLETIEKISPLKRAFNIVSNAAQGLYEATKGKTVVMSEWIKNKKKKETEDKIIQDAEYEDILSKSNRSEPDHTDNPQESRDSTEDEVEEKRGSRFKYKNLEYGDDDERFQGEKKFLDDEKFSPKDNRNYFSKKLEKKRDNKERVEIKKKYKKVVKGLNESYFNNLLGEKRIQELRNISGEDKKVREEEMLNEILVNEKDPVKRKMLERRFEKRKDAEQYIAEKDAKIRERVDLQRNRRRYSKQVEAEIFRTKEEIKDLKKDKILYDKEDHKLLKTKLEMLRKMEREKEGLVTKVSKFTKEQLENRKKRLESPEMKAVFKKYKKDLQKNLLDSGAKVWKGSTAILTKPLIGLWGGIMSSSPSKAFSGFLDGLGAGLEEGIPDILEAAFKLLNAVAVIPVKAITRYAVAR